MGYAAHGWDYRRILGHYYTDTELGVLRRAAHRPRAAAVRDRLGVVHRRVARGRAERLAQRHLRRARTRRRPGAAAHAARAGDRDRAARRCARPGPVRSRSRARRATGAATAPTAARSSSAPARSAASTRSTRSTSTTTCRASCRWSRPPRGRSRRSRRRPSPRARTRSRPSKGGDRLRSLPRHALPGLRRRRRRAAQRRTRRRSRPPASSSPTRARRSRRTSSPPRAAARRTSRRAALGNAPLPWLQSVEDKYDDVSPRHRWGPIRMTMRRPRPSCAASSAGASAASRCVTRGSSPRIVEADVVGSARARPGVRRRRCARGSGSTTPGRTSRRSGRARRRRRCRTGAPDPGEAADRARAGRRRSGRERDPARKGARVRRPAPLPRPLDPAGETATTVGGRYGPASRAHGLYRIVYRGDAGRGRPDALAAARRAAGCPERAGMFCAGGRRVEHGTSRRMTLLWTQKHDGGSSARDFPTMTFDAAREQVVLFGGQEDSGAAVADTWSWDGTDWIQLSDMGPSPRVAAAIAYDAAREQVVLVGGFGTDITSTETWAWDGVEWTQLADFVGPDVRAMHAMAFDPVRELLILFGGIDGASNALADTWAWTGNQWEQLADSGPKARFLHAMTFDAVAGACCSSAASARYRACRGRRRRRSATPGTGTVRAGQAGELRAAGRPGRVDGLRRAHRADVRRRHRDRQPARALRRDLAVGRPALGRAPEHGPEARWPPGSRSTRPAGATCSSAARARHRPARPPPTPRSATRGRPLIRPRQVTRRPRRPAPASPRRRRASRRPRARTSARP